MKVEKRNGHIPRKTLQINTHILYSVFSSLIMGHFISFSSSLLFYISHSSNRPFYFPLPCPQPGQRSFHQLKKSHKYIPICDQTNSVKPPINCGVALIPNFNVSSSTILPIANQRAALRRFLLGSRGERVSVSYVWGLGGWRGNVVLLLPRLRRRCHLWLSCLFMFVYVCILCRGGVEGWLAY